MVTEAVNRLNGRKDSSNDAKGVIEGNIPYQVQVRLQGTSDMLFHRWSCEAVAEKAASAKGSKAKKTDDVNSFVYRTKDDMLAIPGVYLRQSILGAAKFKQDPRSPRKSAVDLFKAGLISTTDLAPIMYEGKKVKNWSYLHQARVLIQRNAITRSRPAFESGWQADFVLSVLLPEYISPDLLREVIEGAGKFVGLGDFRPTYGRFSIVKYEVMKS